MEIGKYLNVVLLAFIWGTLYAAQGYANINIGAYTTGVFTFLLCLVLLTIHLIATKKFGDLFTVKKLWPKLLLIGIVGFSVNFTNFFGFQLGDAQTGAFILKIDVLMVNIVSVLLLKEKFSKKDWFYSLIMFIGVLMIVGVNFAEMTFNFGDLFFVASAILLTWNTFNIAGVLKQAKVPISQMTVAYYNVLIMTTLFTTMFFATNSIADIGVAFSSTGIIIALVVAGLTQYGLFVTYYKALAELPAWIVKVILLLIPVITMVITFFIYGTVPTSTALIGCGIVLISAFGIIREQQVKASKEKAKKINNINAENAIKGTN